MSNIQSIIMEKTEYEKELTAYSKSLLKRTNIERLDYFAKLRAFNQETVDEAGIFYIGDMTEMLLPNYIDKVDDFGVISPTNLKPIFRNRWVIPIKTPEGLVQNFVGYSPYANERYIYGTAKYYRRQETLYGLENLEMAYDMGYALVTEGITDTIRLRDLGYKNSFAMCGTNTSDFVLRQLNRCRHGVILIPDRDDPGLRALKNWIYNRSMTIFINFAYKDVDEMCANKQTDSEIRIKNENNIAWLKEAIDSCIDWIKSDEHRGKSGINEKITLV